MTRPPGSGQTRLRQAGPGFDPQHREEYEALAHPNEMRLRVTPAAPSLRYFVDSSSRSPWSTIVVCQPSDFGTIGW
jgi:hypothetical protein